MSIEARYIEVVENIDEQRIIDAGSNTYVWQLIGDEHTSEKLPETKNKYYGDNVWGMNTLNR